MLEVHSVAALADNYIYLLRDTATGVTAVVDPAEAGPVVAALDRLGWGLDLILNTHHHGDHIGGNAELKRRYGCRVEGPASDQWRIKTLDRGLVDGDVVRVGASEATVMFVPGHTSGHIALWFRESQALFSGDALFSLGCGRLFEGTPEEMWRSLSRLAALPTETRVYCAHEYTEANGRFALAVDPGNEDLKERMREVVELRARGHSTLPSTVEREKKTNPFLRAGSVARFAELRAAKDSFR